MVPGPTSFSRKRALALPMPCSPERVPPRARATSKMACHCGLHPVPFLLVAAVREDGGVEVAVPGVAEGADGQSKFPADLLDGPDHGGDLAAGHGGVFQDHGGFQFGQGRECCPAGRQTRSRSAASWAVCTGSPQLPAEGLHLLGLLRHHRRVAVHLDQEQGRRVHREPTWL